jgi:hypothetical protein
MLTAGTAVAQKWFGHSPIPPLSPLSPAASSDRRERLKVESARRTKNESHRIPAAAMQYIISEIVLLAARYL